MSTERPFRFRLLLFDDENFTKLLNYDRMLRAGFASLHVEKRVSDETEHVVVRLSAEDGYLFDVVGVRYVRAAREEFRGAPDVVFDFAFVDWKDLLLVPEGQAASERSELMGFLLALEARRRNPACTIILMSSYPAEIRDGFDTSWVREILGSEANGTRDLSADDRSRDKFGVLRGDSFVLAEERKKALGFLLRLPQGDVEILSQRLRTLPALIAPIGREATKELQDVDQAKVAFLGGYVSSSIRSRVETLIGAEIVGQRLDWLFPFRFAGVYRELQIQQSRVSDYRNGSDLKLEALEELCAELVPFLRSTLDRVGCEVVRQVASRRSEKYVCGETQVAGIHLNRTDPAALRCLATAMPLRIERLIRERNLVGDEWKALREGLCAVTDELSRAITAIDDDATRLTTVCDRVEDVAHSELRIRPFKMFRDVIGSGHWQATAGRGWTADRTFRWSGDEPIGDEGLDLNGVWCYGGKRDAHGALEALLDAWGVFDRASARSEWADSFGSYLHITFEMEWNKSLSRHDLEALAAGDGNTTSALTRLWHHFSVAVGNASAMVQFPLGTVPGRYETEPATSVQLTCLIRGGTEDGNGRHGVLGRRK